jgi:hypothetical protein
MTQIAIIWNHSIVPFASSYLHQLSKKQSPMRIWLILGWIPASWYWMTNTTALNPRLDTHTHMCKPGVSHIHKGDKGKPKRTPYTRRVVSCCPEEGIKYCETKTHYYYTLITWLIILTYIFIHSAKVDLLEIAGCHATIIRRKNAAQYTTQP